MSHSRILALGLAEEGFHQFGQFLDSAQRAECQPLHFVLGLHQLPGYPALDVRPNLLVGVQLRRVRRQVEQLELAVLGFDKFLDQLRLVNRVTIDNEEDRRCGANHQSLEKFPEHLGIDRAVVKHETEFTARTDRRDHVQREAASGDFHDRRFTDGWPRRPRVVVGANARFIGKVDGCTLGFGFGTNHRIKLGFPGSHQRRVLLPRLVERFLRREAQQFHDPADRGQRQLLAEFALDQRRDQRQGPQAKDKLELQRGAVAHRPGKRAKDAAHIDAVGRRKAGHVLPFTNPP